MKVRFVAGIAGIPAVSDQRTDFDRVSHVHTHAIVREVAVKRGRAIRMSKHRKVVEPGRRDLSIEVRFLDVNDLAGSCGDHVRSNRHEKVVTKSARAAMTIAWR